MGVVKKFYITKFKEERPKIELKNISLSFNKRQILDNISLTIREGEICGLLGPNGVGKSTIFNIIIGLLTPDYGEVFINKKKVTNLPIYRRALDFGVSIVPQSGGIFSDLTCYQNLNAIADLVIREKKDIADADKFDEDKSYYSISRDNNLSKNNHYKGRVNTQLDKIEYIKMHKPTCYCKKFKWNWGEACYCEESHPCDYTTL